MLNKHDIIGFIKHVKQRLQEKTGFQETQTHTQNHTYKKTGINIETISPWQPIHKVLSHSIIQFM